MSNDYEEQKKNLKISMNNAFRYITKRLIPTEHGFGDPTVMRYDITYNKKLKHIEILKIVTVNQKLVVLEPPLWISKRHYDPQIYLCDGKDCRILILSIYSQIPDVKKHVEKIMKLQKL